MPENETVDRNAQLNPQVVDVQIGVRNLRTIKVYPLAMADQLELTDIISNALQDFVAVGNTEDIAFVGAVIQLIKDNLARILEMATDEKGEELLKDLTNPQAMAIAELIFDTNYGSLGKNVRSLSEKVRSLFQSARPSQQSLNDTVDTDSKISSENLTEKVE